MADEHSGNLDMNFGMGDGNGVNALTLNALLNNNSITEEMVEDILSTCSLSELMILQNISSEQRAQASQNRRKTTTPRKRLSDDGSGRSPRPSGGQYLNLPASAPITEYRDGIEYLIFTYSTRGQQQEYTIRVDIDNVHSDDIPDDFKADNCVYPRALCPRDQYVGNRWEYETACNDLAWRLCWMNQHVLCAKRGLIQRAVDSYRNRTQDCQSRRVTRQKKLEEGTLRRRTLEQEDFDSRSSKAMFFTWNNKGVPTKCRIRIDIENVDINELDEIFKRNNCIYPRAMTDMNRTVQMHVGPLRMSATKLHGAWHI